MIYTKQIKVDKSVKGISPTMFRNYILSKIESLDKNDLEKIQQYSLLLKGLTTCIWYIYDNNIIYCRTVSQLA